jgi:hypothetical protein
VIPTIAELDGGITIAMYYNDHNPPHFHAIRAGHEFRVLIGRRGLFAGDGGPRAMVRQVLDWADGHRAELAECWARARAAQRPGRIE